MTTNNAAIIAKQRGSFDPRVILSDNRNVSLVDLMIESYNQSGNVGGVKDTIALSYTRNQSNDTNSFLYSTSSTPEAMVRVPTLSELGYSETGYRLDVIATGYFRVAAPDPTIEVRLVDAAGNAVSASLGTGRIISNLVDTPIQTVKAEVTGGTAYALDFRRTSGAEEILLYNFSLLIQVVKV